MGNHAVCSHMHARSYKMKIYTLFYLRYCGGKLQCLLTYAWSHKIQSILFIPFQGSHPCMMAEDTKCFIDVISGKLHMHDPTGCSISKKPINFMRKKITVAIHTHTHTYTHIHTHTRARARSQQQSLQNASFEPCQGSDNLSART